MKKIFLYAHGGSGNRGCEAIIRGTSKILSDNFYTKTLFSMRVDEDRNVSLDKFYRIIPHNSKIIRIIHKNKFASKISSYIKNFGFYNYIAYNNLIKMLDNTCIALSVGGDNYCYNRPTWLYYINKGLKKRDVKLVLWGCSIEPSKIDNKMVKDLKQFDIIITRESITYNAIIEKRLSHVYLYPDPAFIIDKKNIKLPANFEIKNTVGINLSPLIIKQESSKCIVYKNYAKLLQYILDTTKSKIALIPHVFWRYSDDREPLKKLYNQFKSTKRVILIDQRFNSMEIKYIISQLSLLIAARTHASIAGYSSCVPTLVVGYSVKAKGIARDIFGSEEDMIISVKSLKNEDYLVKTFKVFKSKEDKIRSHLLDFMPSYIKKAYQAGEEVKKLLEG